MCIVSFKVIVYFLFYLFYVYHREVPHDELLGARRVQLGAPHDDLLRLYIFSDYIHIYIYI